MGAEHEVEMSLRRKFPEEVKNTELVAKEDLSLSNHLSGLKKNYIKLLFNNTKDLTTVRKLLLPTVLKNRDKRRALAPHEGRVSVTRATDGWLDYIEDIREYDVRCAALTPVACCLIGLRLCRCRTTTEFQLILGVAWESGTLCVTRVWV